MVRDRLKVLESYKKYFQKYPIRFKLKRARTRAIKKGLEFDLVEEDIKIPDVCPVLGIPIGREASGSPQNSSIDRIDPSRGYTKDNIRVISHRANMLKNNATIEELELILADARNIKNGYCEGTVRSPDVEDDVDATGRQ